MAIPCTGLFHGPICTAHRFCKIHQYGSKKPLKEIPPPTEKRKKSNGTYDIGEDIPRTLLYQAPS
jgi:hypothetical protein